jgi:hypothetical protein
MPSSIIPPDLARRIESLHRLGDRLAAKRRELVEAAGEDTSWCGLEAVEISFWGKKDLT